ncbi:hypothetical protein ABZ766_27400 [Streptomyces sp. NPDC006670]
MADAAELTKAARKRVTWHPYDALRAGWEHELLRALDRAARLAPL